MHCHLDDGSTFKIFSFADLVSFAELAKLSTRPTSELYMYVTTDSGTFAIKINDREKLKKKLTSLNEISYILYDRTFSSYVKNTDDLETQTKGFLKFLKNTPGLENPGIDLYRKYDNNQWKKLALSPNNIVIDPTNCN